MKKEEKYFRLYSILSSSDNWVPAKEVAASMQATTRTVQNYVNELNSADNEFPVILSSHQGYKFSRMRLYAYSDKRIDDAAHAAHIHQSRDSRVWHIIRLILEMQPDFNLLLQELCISKSTLNKDLGQVRSIAKSFNLRVRRKNDHFSFSGCKKDVRALILKCTLLTLQFSYTTLSIQVLKKIFPEYSIESLEIHFQQILNEHDFYRDPLFFHSALFLILLQAREIKKGQVIRAQEWRFQYPADCPEYKAASKLAAYLSEAGNIQYNPYELEYLSTVLDATCQYRAEAVSCSNSFHPAYDLFARDLLHRLFSGVSYDVHYDSFSVKLGTHIHRMIARNQLQIQVYSPLSGALREKYPVIHEISLTIIKEINRHFDVNIYGNEVGVFDQFLCTYLEKGGYPAGDAVPATLVCPVYGEFAETLAERIAEKLSRFIHISRIITDVGVEHLADDGGLYISLMTLPPVKHAVYISMYPDAEDFLRILSEVCRIQKQSRYENYVAHMADCLFDAIYKKPPVHLSSKTFIKDICNHLEHLDLIKEDFCQDILQREQTEISVFHESQLFLHARGDNVVKDFLYIFDAPRNFFWHGYTIDTVLVFGCSQESALQNYYTSIDSVVKAFSYPETTIAYRKNSSASGFLNTLRSYYGDAKQDISSRSNA